MSDNRRRFIAIHRALLKFYPTTPHGNLARHLLTLAQMISGIVGSKRVDLPAVASKVYSSSKPESRVKRFKRWITNERIDSETYYLPYARQLLANLADQRLVLVIDGSAIGRGCRTLMLSVVYKNRALPVAWFVASGSRGHFAESDHIALIEQTFDLLPEGADVILLGDGEFDGIFLLAKIESYDWKYVCRTALDTILTQDQEELTFASLGVCPGERITLPEVTITRSQYGPVTAIAWWDDQYEDPIYLVSNLGFNEDPCYWYSFRFVIETFFSDQKSRGFHLNKSHICEPSRLAQLMIAACLAYIFIVYLGCLAIEEGWSQIIHRTDRCDLSVFQLGLRLLEHFLNLEMDIPVAFLLLE